MIALASIAFNSPRAITEQVRLLKKFLKDDYELVIGDASTSPSVEDALLQSPGDFHYHGLPSGAMHHEGLNWAGRLLEAQGAPYIGFLDHDVFPIRRTTLIDKIEEAGFYGIGQRHPATGHLYLWPGFCFFSREWLAGRPLDFSGIRDGDKRNDGDTGSANWPLFVDEDWESMYKITHSYGVIRKPDDYGLQSFGYEMFGDWLHFSNASHWMKVPDPEGRDEALFALLADL